MGVLCRQHDGHTAGTRAGTALAVGDCLSALLHTPSWQDRSEPRAHLRYPRTCSTLSQCSVCPKGCTSPLSQLCGTHTYGHWQQEGRAQHGHRVHKPKPRQPPKKLFAAALHLARRPPARLLLRGSQSVPTVAALGAEKRWWARSPTYAPARARSLQRGTSQPTHPRKNRNQWACISTHTAPDTFEQAATGWRGSTTS